MRSSVNEGPDQAPRSIKLMNDEDQSMDAAMERRVTVATGWASTRIAVLDKDERYEDSYAIAQEFQEWITSIGEDTSILEANVMPVPRNPDKYRRLFDSRNNDNHIEI